FRYSEWHIWNSPPFRREWWRPVHYTKLKLNHVAGFVHRIGIKKNLADYLSMIHEFPRVLSAYRKND
ncbi:hypothetical protein, partial [Desulforhabdus sp. TSK]|uniref:hypothetical protein n=1 Tax=Desulforhabdus sp. TSK TaxID=2925014 RepID=UPI001FC7BFB8